MANSDLAGILSEIALVHDLHNPTVQGPIHGLSHDIYVLQHPSGIKWSLRIQKSSGAAARDYRQGVSILKHIKTCCPELEVPRFLHMGDRYMILEFLKGKPIGSWIFEDRMRHGILEGLAKFLVKLWSCRAPATSTTGLSYEDWLTREVDLALIRSIRNLGWGDPIHFLHRRHMIKELIPDTSELGMAVRHGDVNPFNVIIDNDELSGVIDWDTAQWVPTQAAIQHPLFIADIPGWLEDQRLDPKILEDDRSYLENEIRKLSFPNISDLLSSARDRQFFEMSLRSKRINREYVTARLAGHEFEKADALLELDSCLSSKLISEDDYVEDRIALLELQTRLQTDMLSM